MAWEGYDYGLDQNMLHCRLSIESGKLRSEHNVGLFRSVPRHREKRSASFRRSSRAVNLCAAEIQRQTWDQSTGGCGEYHARLDRIWCTSFLDSAHLNSLVETPFLVRSSCRGLGGRVVGNRLGDSIRTDGTTVELRTGPFSRAARCPVTKTNGKEGCRHKEGNGAHVPNKNT